MRCLAILPIGSASGPSFINILTDVLIADFLTTQRTVNGDLTLTLTSFAFVHPWHVVASAVQQHQGLGAEVCIVEAVHNAAAP